MVTAMAAAMTSHTPPVMGPPAGAGPPVTVTTLTVTPLAAAHAAVPVDAIPVSTPSSGTTHSAARYGAHPGGRTSSPMTPHRSSFAGARSGPHDLAGGRNDGHPGDGQHLDAVIVGGACHCWGWGDSRRVGADGESVVSRGGATPSIFVTVLPGMMQINLIHWLGSSMYVYRQLSIASK